MKTYILRRLLLMIPTLVGISLVCFILIQLIPGGPVEELVSRAQSAAAMRGGTDASKALSPEQIAQIQQALDNNPITQMKNMQFDILDEALSTVEQSNIRK